jgi:uncharacterized membrane protein|tara:strand:- start:301 stop:462 length:162 start_codon:yes stop_codon:yes gene_type:complete
MNIEITSWLMAMAYMVMGGMTMVFGLYSMYWMVVELPVLLRIKREELYNRWRD